MGSYCTRLALDIFHALKDIHSAVAFKLITPATMQTRKNCKFPLEVFAVSTALSSKRTTCIFTVDMGEFWNQCGNDPSAGSPTETLLRLHLPLNDKVQTSSHDMHHSTHHNLEASPDHSIGRCDGRCVQRAGT
jgi:hypothetical protein